MSRSNLKETIRLLPVRQSVPFPARPQFFILLKASLDEVASLNLEIIRRHRQALGLSLAVKGYLRTYSRIWLRVLLAPFSKLSNSNFPPPLTRETNTVITQTEIFRYGSIDKVNISVGAGLSTMQVSARDFKKHELSCVGC
jgi:hypothetical protein